jgi:hypothetical protein
LSGTLRQLALFLAAAASSSSSTAAAPGGPRSVGFRTPWRRGLGLAVLALVLARLGWHRSRARIAVREPISRRCPPGALRRPVLLGAAVVRDRLRGQRELAAQVGLSACRPLEIGFGVLFGIGACGGAGRRLAVAMLLVALGGVGMVPQKPPEAVVYLAGRSVLPRRAGARGGTVEELFFRGLMRARVGILLDGAFASAHLSYGQPFLLVGVTLLSLLYALLVRWRQSLWAAMAAHTLFDMVQLLVVVPTLLHDFRGFWAP